MSKMAIKPKRGGIVKLRKVFSLISSIILVSSTLLMGISFNAPNVSAGSVDHNVGDLWVEQLTDYGRILKGFTWNAEREDIRDPLTTWGYNGLVIDHDGYDHTPPMNIADSYDAWPYGNQADFRWIVGGGEISMLVDDGTLEKSFASFINNGPASPDPNDILINQTAWTMVSKDWAIVQWTLYNTKGLDLTNVAISLEVPLSHAAGAHPNSGLGGDHGDDIDGYDATDDIYWAQDDSGTTIGFSSAIISDPITHYYSEDYYDTYTWNEYYSLYANDTWLYNRLRAPNSVVGATPGNRSSTVGWDGFTLSPGTPRTVTLVVAVNDTFDNMKNAIKDAQYFYHNTVSGFLISEFSDDPTTQRIEMYNNGREPTDLVAGNYAVSNDGGATFLPGNWNPTTIPTYGYSVFTVTGTPIGPEGDSISLWYDPGGGYELVDGPYAFGREGTVPDPLDGDSVSRHFDTGAVAYNDDWLQTDVGGSTWGSQNNVGYRISSGPVMLNRVMFNPFNSAESYIEVHYRGITISIDNYRIVCDDEFIIPLGITLNANNPFFVIKYSQAPALFNNMDTNGDNVYLYNSIGNLLDMAGWSSAHTQGHFMGRVPDATGTTQGFSDTTSLAAGWIFDQEPTMIITEISADTATTAQIEVYNSRGGDKVFNPGVWAVDSDLGTMIGSWSTDPLPGGGYSVFTRAGGMTVDPEGDTFSLTYSGSITIDSVSFGTDGPAPDPLVGESTGRYWNSSTNVYSNDWNRNASTGTTWGVQNDVPPINPSPYIVLQEVMFNPSSDPDGHFLVLYNIMDFGVNIADWRIIGDDIFVFPPGVLPGDVLPAFTLLIIRYNDFLSSQPMFNSMDVSGDNMYLYDKWGGLQDMVGWDSIHLMGMSVKRVPEGWGTYQGHDDITSEAAGWVFNVPLEVLMTEISDSESSQAQIEVYNPWYPSIDFNSVFTFENELSVTLPGSWMISTADSGEYAVFNVTSGLGFEGDTISFYQDNVLIEAISYGQNGVVPDPLKDESVERYWNSIDGIDGTYTNVWERNWTSGPNFGAQNDVPEPKLTSPIMLNEVLFYPNVTNNHFVELYNRGAAAVDISGYKIVCDTEYIIPIGTVLNFDERFFYLLYNMNNVFFDNMDSSGDNIYLYDERGSLLDMVGWNSQHTIGQTISRVPQGNGTRDGYEDVSSVAAGWRFDRIPTVRLIKIDINRMIHWEPYEYGHFGSYVLYHLIISNFQQIGDIVNILNSSEEGWALGIFDETGTIKIDNISMIADSTIFILVNVTLPDSIPFAVMDNITISILSSNNAIIRDSIVLNVRVYPFLNLTKNASPKQIYINGTGHDEITTITLNMTGMGEKEGRPYLDTVFCIDSSGSMTGNDPMDLRKVESQNFVAEHFGVPDRAAVVDFDSDAYLQPDGWPIGDHLSSNYAKIIANIELIDSSGGTDVPSGINMSNEELRLYGQPADHIPIIILLTDAQGGDPAACIQEANIAASRGVIIFTIGLAIPNGSTSEQLLIDIANITGGMYFEAPDASYFTHIYENISGILTDLAVWDNDTTDPHPMARDVLPWYIDYIPGTFSIPPDNIFNDSVTGETIIEWNIPWVKLGQTWSVSFDVKSNLLGLQETNVYNKSRAFYTRWDDTTDTVLFPRCWVYVLPPAPMPPKLYIDTLPNKNDIYLYWDEPLFLGTDHYLIYRSTNPTGFDFSTPWVDTKDVLANGVDPIGLSVIPNRLSWNHTGAANPLDGEYSEQWYYCIRAVNAVGEMSHTSRTVGKWTRNFTAGNGTFSFPLQPLFDETTEYYTQDMNARLIKWIDPGTRTWVQHDPGEMRDNTFVEVGRGYEADFIAPTRYTFLGMPGAMIRYKTDSPFGFDYATEANSLTASVNPINGDVTLIWTQPASMDSGQQYYLYHSTTRDGFFGTRGIDYTLISMQPYGSEMAVHTGAAKAGTQNYYMIIPVNATNAEGASTYSIGVWTSNIMAEYDTIGIPLQQISGDQTADWYCDNIQDAVGINYFMYSQQRWGWHSTRMPAGAFDPILIMTEGYQISTSSATKFTFIGI